MDDNKRDRKTLSTGKNIETTTPCEWTWFLCQFSLNELQMKVSTHRGPAQKTRFLEITGFLFHVTDEFYDIQIISVNCWQTTSVLKHIPFIRTNKHAHGVIWSCMWCPESYDSLRIQNTHKYTGPLESPDLLTTCKNTSWSPVTICPKSNGGCKERFWYAFTSCLWRCRNNQKTISGSWPRF